MIKYAKIKGPRISPRIPNINNPPIIPIITIAECKFVLFETIIGLKKLSTVLETSPKIKIPIAEVVCNLFCV